MKDFFFKDIQDEGKKTGACSDKLGGAGKWTSGNCTWAAPREKNPKPVGEKLRWDPIPLQSAGCTQALTAAVPLEEPEVRVEKGRPVKPQVLQAPPQLRSAGHLPFTLRAEAGALFSAEDKAEKRVLGRDSISAHLPSGSPSQPSPHTTGTRLCPPGRRSEDNSLDI